MNGGEQWEKKNLNSLRNANDKNKSKNFAAHKKNASSKIYSIYILRYVSAIKNVTAYLHFILLS